MIFVREDREDRNFAQSIQRSSRKGPGPSPGPAPGPFRGAERGGGFAGRGGGAFRPERGGFTGRDARPAPAPVSRTSRGATHGRQIFVGNLPYTSSWQDLKDKFRQCGNIIRADILLDTTGRSKGQGTVLFETSNEAQKAINMFDNTEFQGRSITVHEDKFA